MINKIITEVIYPLSLNEKVMIAGYSGLAGVGTAALLPNITWYAVTPTVSAWLVIPLVETAAVLTITGVGIATAIIAIPIAWITYDVMINDHRDKIFIELKQREKNHANLFIELLRLRKLYQNQKIIKSSSINFIH